MKPSSPFLRIVVEGLVDEAIARRLAQETGFSVGAVFVKHGKDQINRRLPAYAAAARFGPWLVLRDLDHDADCAPTLIQNLLREPPPNLLVRIPVRCAESWLIADASGLAAFLGIGPLAVPDRPDELQQPKRSLVGLAARSRHRLLRDDLMPPSSSRAIVGPGYTSRLVEFVSQSWQPDRASQRSASLKKCLGALRKLRARF